MPYMVLPHPSALANGILAPQELMLSTKSICTCDNRCAILHHALRRAANMPRFYFHLSAPDQDFPDNIGSDVTDLAAAHSIAVRLMKRVMMISAFADCAPDLRRWTVKVTDERRRPVFTVLFPAYFAPRGWKPVLVSGARTLLMRLDAMNAVDDKSQGHIPVPPLGAFKARVPTQVASSPTARRRVTVSGRRRRKNGLPLPRQPWQVPLRSVITFCRLYPNECDVAVTPTSGGRNKA